MGKHKTGSLFSTQEAEEYDCKQIIRVAFEAGVDKEFDYCVPEQIWGVKVGQRVKAPFGAGNKLKEGFCVQTDEQEQGSLAEPGRKLKHIKSIVDDEPLVNDELMLLARWISEYYVCPLGQVLAAMVPSAVKRGAGTSRQIYVYLKKDLSGEEQRLRGKKQRHIMDILKNRGAVDDRKAVPLEEVLGEAGCTKIPAKSLFEKGLVRFSERVRLRSLPAIPEGMEIKSGPIKLNEDQHFALEHISAEIESGGFGVTVLHGVTGSGKTETYMRAIESTLAKGKGAIVLLPEIALTAQTVQRFSGRFERLAVLHSGLTGAQRNGQWQMIKRGDADVVIGARSAVFAPLPEVGLIVVDEEHEGSYKQETAPRYNGRDVAIKRTQISGGHCILGSATPSLETLLNCRTKQHFHLLRLPKRVLNLEMPEMRLVDLSENYTGGGSVNMISTMLEEHLNRVLHKKEQAILLLNRRGYSNLIYCPTCGHILHCRNCDVTLTFHKKVRVAGNYGTRRMQTVMGRHMSSGHAVCHHCGAETLVPRGCPLCGKAMTMIGIGSQRLEEQLREKFKEAKVVRVDADSMKRQDYYRVLKEFGEGRIDILSGTQILAKGLHFPNVTLVGIISADTCLYLPDFRSNERTFQLICQVSGRAGRSEKKGLVLVQTFFAEQPAIQFALRNDYDGFVEEELKHRKACKLPPYRRLAAILMRDRYYDKLEQACKIMRQRTDFIIRRDKLDILVRGPLPAVISRVQGFHRMQILLQSPEAGKLVDLFSKLRKAGPIKPSVKVAIDVDPVNLL